MPSLSNEVIDRTTDRVRIVYINREITRWWNERRKSHDTAAFTGWYWLSGNNEAGPFKTRSAAIRDAYYQIILGRDLPSIGRNAPQERTLQIRSGHKRVNGHGRAHA